MTVGLEYFLILSAVLFCIGLYGVLTRRNVIIILMCIEIMLNAANIALVAFSRYVTPAILQGQIFAIFIITVAAAEVAVGIAMIIAIYRRRQSINADTFDLLKW